MYISVDFQSDKDPEVLKPELARLEGAVDSLKQQGALQSDLDILEHQAMFNGIKFNKTKMSLGSYVLHALPKKHAIGSTELEGPLIHLFLSLLMKR